MIMGDLNAVVSEGRVSSVVGNYGLNDRGKITPWSMRGTEIA